MGAASSTGESAGLVARGCVKLLVLVLAANVALVVLLLGARDTLVQGVEKTAVQPLLRLASPVGSDSWGPMAYAHEEIRSGRDMYAIFFEGVDRYQYPPSALLLNEALPAGTVAGQDSVAAGTPFNRAVSWMSRIAVIVTIALAAALLLVTTERLQGARMPGRDKVIAAAAFSAAGLLFYPLLYANQLGQIQVFVNLFLVLSLLCWTLGARIPAGVLLGLCTLIKPQYGLIVVWGLLARQWRFTAAFTLTAAAGIVASLAAFGLKPWLQYMDVLQFLSRRGESYWPNQSMNGLMNRLLGNGDPRELLEFPPYSLVVHVTTLTSSALIILAALLPGMRGPSSTTTRGGDTPYAFGAYLAGLTLASPIAWEHHYGFFVGLFALLLPAAALRTHHSGNGPELLVMLAYAAMACVFTHPDFLFNPMLGLLASHLYFGGLLVLALLLYYALGPLRPDARPVRRPA